MEFVSTLITPITDFLNKGGITIWAIAMLSVLTLAIILWKIWRLALLGAWSRNTTQTSVDSWVAGNGAQALTMLGSHKSIRAQVARAAMNAVADPQLSGEAPREETARVAKGLLAEARGGLRALELIATVAPLLGLLGTVLGMIVAFQALQDAGSRADPSALAGGIWEALLTTAAGMAVAIPASVSLTWFESVIDRIRLDMEDSATRIFTRAPQINLPMAAE